MHVAAVLRIQHATEHQGERVMDRLDDIATRAFLNANVVRDTQVVFGEGESLEFVVTDEGQNLAWNLTLLDSWEGVRALLENSLRAEAAVLRKRLIVNGLATANLEVSVRFGTPEALAVPAEEYPDADYF